MKVTAVLLAAGQGLRMKSKLLKVLHPVCGKPMLVYALAVAGSASTEKPVVVIGKDGHFQTALLEPGTYTLVAEVYVWGQLPEPYPVGDDEPRYGGVLRMRPSSLAYVGSAKVTVSTNAASPVRIELVPRGKRD